MQQLETMNWCATRCIDLAVTEAAVALDTVSAQPAVTANSVGERLLAGRVPCAPEATLASPVRRYEGSISIGALVLPVSSELVLAPWSSSASELCVRPLTRRPPEWRANAYWNRVHAFLDDLTLKLESVAFLRSTVRHDAIPDLIAAIAA